MGIFIFGSVFFVMIGVEVLYFDMGYVGKVNIDVIWLFVYMILIFNYFG